METPFAMSPLADQLGKAKAEAEQVLNNYPNDADGGLSLEHAIGLLGEVQDELDRAQDRVDGTEA